MRRRPKFNDAQNNKNNLLIDTLDGLDLKYMSTKNKLK